MKKILIVFIAFLAMTACRNKTGMRQNETNKNCKANAISNEQLADLLYGKQADGIQFIDIRTPHEYAMGHLPNAINIPMSNFFDDAYFSKLKKDNVLILYGKDASSPRMMALMAGHFKKGYFNVALGGYDYLKDKILDNYAIYSGLYDDEVPLVDYQQVINEIKSRSGASTSTAKPKPKANTKPLVKHKKKEVTGGCG